MIHRDWIQWSPLWVDTISMAQPKGTLWIREAFRGEVKVVLEEQRNIKHAGTERGVPWYDQFKQTKNWDIIINPDVEVINWEVTIRQAQVWKYETYHALNNLRSGDEVSGSKLDTYKYEVLSAWWVFYDPWKESFYLYKRPDDSQEAPGEVDLIGGCMNTTDGLNEDGEIDPTLYTASRLSSKWWIEVDPESLEFMWIQKFQKRGFQNLVYLCVLEKWEWDRLDSDRVSEIPLSDVEKYLSQDNPGGSWLTLVLSHPMFEDKWYGKDVIQRIIDWN